MQAERRGRILLNLPAEARGKFVGVSQETNVRTDENELDSHAQFSSICMRLSKPELDATAVPRGSTRGHRACSPDAWT